MTTPITPEEQAKIDAELKRQEKKRQADEEAEEEQRNATRLTLQKPRKTVLKDSTGSETTLDQKAAQKKASSDDDKSADSGIGDSFWKQFWIALGIMGNPTSQVNATAIKGVVKGGKLIVKGGGLIAKGVQAAYSWMRPKTPLSDKLQETEEGLNKQQRNFQEDDNVPPNFMTPQLNESLASPPTANPAHAAAVVNDAANNAARTLATPPATAAATAKPAASGPVSEPDAHRSTPKR